MNLLNREIIKSLFKEKGLRITKQRIAIINTFLESLNHPSIEDILNKVRKKHGRISYSTVYRTLKILSDSGFADERHFGDGYTRYEKVVQGMHHDHIICISCGKIIEFESDDIERIQSRVAKKYNFKLIAHKMELYGQCPDCRKD